MKEAHEAVQKRLQEIVSKRNEERTALKEKERAKKKKKWKKDLLRRMRHYNPMFDPEVAKRQGSKMIGNKNRLGKKSRKTEENIK